jgi:hypothetical protein
MLNKITVYTKSDGKLRNIFSKTASESTDGLAYSDKELQKFYEQLSAMKNNLVIKNEVNGIFTMTDKGLTYEGIPFLIGDLELQNVPSDRIPGKVTWVKDFKQTVESLLVEREHSYGDYMTNAILSQKLKTVMRESHNWDKLPMDMKESFEMMAVKIARLLNGDYAHIDGWRDCAGYSTLIADRLQKA